MVFSSITFLFLFLPLVLPIAFIRQPTIRNILLLIASIVFYFWTEGKAITIVALLAFLIYIVGIGIEKIRSSQTKTLVVAISVMLLAFILIYFKYTGFLTTKIGSVLGYIPAFIPPAPRWILGISFITFEAISYIVDISKKRISPEKNPLNVFLYIFFFPHLIAGPIVRYHDIVKSFLGNHQSLSLATAGALRFITGLGKKVLLANTLGMTADIIFSAPIYQISPGVIWLGAITYGLQIFFDFSGYSDMAIGLGLIFGIELPENFNQPYQATSVSNFWRRWHISLSSWFRDYVYIPLGGNRHGMMRTIFAIFCTFFLTGSWHGSKWTFIVWGVYFGILIILERTLAKKFLESLPIFFKHLYLTLIVLIGWVIFKSPSVPFAWIYLLRMVGFGSYTSIEFPFYSFLTPTFVLSLLIGLSLAGGVLQKIPHVPGNLIAGRFIPYVGYVIILVLSLSRLAAMTYNPFIYFRF